MSRADDVHKHNPHNLLDIQDDTVEHPLISILCRVGELEENLASSISGLYGLAKDVRSIADLIRTQCIQSKAEGKKSSGTAACTLEFTGFPEDAGNLHEVF